MTTSEGLGKEGERIKSEKERVDRQEKTMLERRQKAVARAEAITGVDKTERKQLATQRRWDGKWDRRKIKMDAKRY